MTLQEKIYIVIPTFNRVEFCVKCIESILKQPYKNFKIIVIDDNSPDNTGEIIRSKFSEVTVLHGTGDLWWTGATNMGCKYALNNGAQLILTLNDDLILDRYYLELMIRANRQYPNAMIGSLSITLEKEPRLLFAGVISNNCWTAKSIKRGELLAPYKFNLRGLMQTIVLPGRGTLIPREVFRKIGLFDFTNFPHYGADYDFSVRAKKNDFDLFVNTQAIIYSRYDSTGLGNIAMKENLPTFLKSFITFKSPNYLPVNCKYYCKHHPLKIYVPVFFMISIMRTICSYLKRSYNSFE